MVLSRIFAPTLQCRLIKGFSSLTVFFVELIGNLLQIFYNGDAGC